MANTVPRGQQIGDRTWSEIICTKPSGEQRNCNCVRKTVAGTFAFILSGLLILLTMLFLYVGQKGSSPGHMTNNNISLECSNYTYPTCRGELRLIRDLLGMEPSDDAAVLVSTSNITLEQNEDTAILFDYGLDYVMGAQECKSSILSFMCLYLFPVCDGNGTVHRPSREDCHEITMVCKDELEGILNLPGIEGLLHLPDCLSLPNSSSVLSDQPAGQIRETLQKNDFAEHINCSEKFFISNDTCLPRCDKWNTLSEPIASIIDILGISTSISIILLGITILTISCFDFSRMYAFPSVLLLHFIVFIILEASTTLITFIGGKTHMCSSVSLLKAVENPTVLCSTLESLIIYFNSQVTFWWFAYISVLFWQVKFPFKANICKQNGQYKYIYIVLLFFALVTPVVPFIAVIIPRGYSTWMLTPSLCTFKKLELKFFLVLLPLNLSLIIGTPLMIAVIASLIKHRHSKQDSNSKIITADRKILLELCYYVFFFFMCNIIFIIQAIPNDQFATKAYKYFHCESKGRNLCDAPSVLTRPIMKIVYNILYMTVPLVILCTMAPVEKVKHFFKKTFK